MDLPPKSSCDRPALRAPSKWHLFIHENWQPANSVVARVSVRTIRTLPQKWAEGRDGVYLDADLQALKPEPSISLLHYPVHHRKRNFVALSAHQMVSCVTGAAKLTHGSHHFSISHANDGQ